MQTAIFENDVEIPAGPVLLQGVLTIPEHPRGVVLFAHGSGSSRFSPRNQHVAGHLQQRGLGTLLMDLLSPEEEEIDRRTRHVRFDIPLLGERLIAAAQWLSQNEDSRNLPMGCFGASTGAAAALVAA